MNFEYTEFNIQSITRDKINPRKQISPNLPSKMRDLPNAPSRLISNHKSFLEAIEQQYMNQTRQKGDTVSTVAKK